MTHNPNLYTLGHLCPMERLEFMSWYDTIGDVPVGGGDSPRFELGKFRLAISLCKEVENDKGHYFITEFLILSTDTSMQVGSVAGYAVRLDGQYKEHRAKALGEVKEIIASALGFSADSKEAAAIGPEIIPQVLGEKNPLRGLVIDAMFWLKPPSQKARAADPNAKGYTKIRTSPVQEGKAVKHDMPAQAASPASAPASSVATPPSLPPALPAAGPPALPTAPVWPPSGWAKHPDSPAHFWKGTALKTEAELRAMVAAGTA